ncbi:MAG TPA: hypothetical protein VGA23_05590, partial [Methylomirabilota bacterium]
DDAGVEPLLKAQRGGPGWHEAYPAQAHAPPLDAAVAAEDAERCDGVFGQRASVEILDEHRSAGDLHGSETLGEPDADLARAVSGCVQGKNEGEN